MSLEPRPLSSRIHKMRLLKITLLSTALAMGSAFGSNLTSLHDYSSNHSRAKTPNHARATYGAPKGLTTGAVTIEDLMEQLAAANARNDALQVELADAKASGNSLRKQFDEEKASGNSLRALAAQSAQALKAGATFAATLIDTSKLENNSLNGVLNAIDKRIKVLLAEIERLKAANGNSTSVNSNAEVARLNAEVTRLKLLPNLVTQCHEATCRNNPDLKKKAEEACLKYAETANPDEIFMLAREIACMGIDHYKAAAGLYKKAVDNETSIIRIVGAGEALEGFGTPAYLEGAKSWFTKALAKAKSLKQKDIDAETMVAIIIAHTGLGNIDNARSVAEQYMKRKDATISSLNLIIERLATTLKRLRRNNESHPKTEKPTHELLSVLRNTIIEHAKKTPKD